MAARENLPRLVREVQDITSSLFEEFSATGDPITDDNHVLHRLCVKLEYLLQTSMKQKSLLGGTKSYWHWMYDSLKRTKGLSDGLKYVRANKEVRTSRGRGRALIRYSLVHQTLADSFQNCLMNEAMCTQYLKPNCLLLNPAYGRSFVNALYDLNGVHFDLISKGYDLDAAWPTFASKRYPSSADQWRPPGRSTSLGSLNSMVSRITSTSIVMDTPQIRGVRGGGSFIGYEAPGSAISGSNGVPSVDHRVEELVLELDQSDQKIKEQQEALNRLEYDASNMAKSAVEKEDILARVISDLESRNQNLRDAMSNMSTEFQNREALWKNKHTEVSALFQETKESNEKLQSRISVLEQDKRDLEDTVSARMSRITSGFSGSDTNYNVAVTPVDDSEHDPVMRLEASKREQKALEEQLYSLRLKLAAAERKIESEKQALRDSLTAEFESKEMEWRSKLENATTNATTQLVLKLSSFLPDISDEFTLTTQSPTEQVDNVISKLTDMANEFSNLQQASLQDRQALYQFPEHCSDIESNGLLEKYEIAQSERDSALAEVRNLHRELVVANEEIQNHKLKLEAALSEQKHSEVELRDKNFQLEDEITKERQLKQEAMGKAHKWQSKFEHDETDVLHSGSCRLAEDGRLESQLETMQNEKKILEKELLESQAKLDAERSYAQQKAKTAAQMRKQLEKFETKKKESEDFIMQLSTKLQDAGASEHRLKQKMEQCENDIRILKEKDKNSEELLELLQVQIQQVNQALEAAQEEKEQAVSSVMKDKASLHDELSKSISDLEFSLKSKTKDFDDLEKQQRLLAGSLAMKEKELSATNFQLDAVKSCMEEERLRSQKEFDALFGENESRKRMIKSFENKLEVSEKENHDLMAKNQMIQKFERDIATLRGKNDELSTSSNAIEEEFIKAIQKLEKEREDFNQLKDELSEGGLREEDLKNQIEDLNSVIKDLEMKLIQLLKEKDALWKECDELRYLQKLQEEGEETEGKWMEDQEARYCLRCGTQFSFIVRKHHCRLCGKIFCNNCSKQWIITKSDGKHERCCLGCLELHKNKNEIKLLEEEVKKFGDTAGSAQNKTTESDAGDEGSDAEYETITGEELEDSKQSDSTYDDDSPFKSSFDGSVYSTPNAKVRKDEDLPVIPKAMKAEEKSEADESKKAVVSAGESLRLPIVVKTPGTTLFWKFSTDRSIDFQLSYCHAEGEDEQPLIQRCRCNSHSEPVEGEILSKKPGIYILEFDNKFSRFMSKEVSYTLRINDRPAP